MQHIFSALRRFPFVIPLLFASILTPLLVLPWFLDAYEVHKATLVIIAAMISGILFLAHAMRERTLTLRFSWFMLFPLGFFAATCVSAVFSLSPISSWLGLGGADYASVLFVGSCVLMVFLLSQAHETAAFLGKYIRIAWVATAFLTAGLLALILSQQVFESISFGWIKTIPSVLFFGTPHALGIFMGCASLFWLGKLTEEERSGIGSRVIGYALLASWFGVAFFLDAWVLWLPMFLSGLILFSLQLARPKQQGGLSHTLPATILVVVPLVGWFLPSFFQGLFPGEIVPSFSLSVDIAKSVWSEGLRAGIGSGAGTYGISYALHALPGINATMFWNVIFDRGFSYILTLAPTIGVLGVLSFVGTQIAGVWIGFRAWASTPSEHRGWVLGAYLAFLFVSMSAWTYAGNVTVIFTMFVLLGLLFAVAPLEKRTWSFAASPQASALASLGFVASLVGLSLVLFIAGTRYVAEIAYAQAIALNKEGAAPEDVLAKIDEAASFNRWNDVYYRELSVLLLQRINSLVAAQAPSDQIQTVLGAAINSAVRATEIGPNVVANWEVRGNVYREVAPAVANAADFSIASFSTAIQLAPNNPLYLVGLGRAYLTKADLLLQIVQGDDAALKTEATAARTEALAQAEDAFTRAIALKNDYTAARYFISSVYERENKLADAVKSMEVVRALNMSDEGVGMQLSLLYLRQGKNDLARAELERVISLSPTYANARWYLSVILEQKGDLAGALAQVAEVAKTNPDNESVQQRLARLQSGEASDDAALPEPISEETTPLDASSTDATDTLPVTP